MVQGGCPAHAARAPQALRAPSSRHGHPPRDTPWCRPTGRTSRPEPPTNGPHRKRSGYSEKQCHPTSRSPRERRPEDRTTDAMGTAVPKARFRGRSQALLYNEVRPHSSLDYLTPNEFAARQANAASRRATGQGAAVCGPPRPGPLHNPLRQEHMQEARDAVSS